MIKQWFKVIALGVILIAIGLAFYAFGELYGFMSFTYERYDPPAYIQYSTGLGGLGIVLVAFGSFALITTPKCPKCNARIDWEETERLLYREDERYRENERYSERKRVYSCPKCGYNYTEAYETKEQLPAALAP